MLSVRDSSCLLEQETISRKHLLSKDVCRSLEERRREIRSSLDDSKRRHRRSLIERRRDEGTKGNKRGNKIASSSLLLFLSLSPSLFLYFLQLVTCCLSPSPSVLLPLACTRRGPRGPRLERQADAVEGKRRREERRATAPAAQTGHWTREETREACLRDACPSPMERGSNRRSFT